MHERRSAYERSYQLARSGGEARLVEARWRAAESAEQPRPVSLAGVRLRDVAAELIAALREAAGDSDARVTAVLEQLSGIEDFEAMEAELAAVRAEALARDAELEARLARTEAELGVERRRAEEASQAAEASEELAEALRAQIATFEETAARVEGELAAARAAAEGAAAQAAERQTRLEELGHTLAGERRQREELDGQVGGLRREYDELTVGLRSARERTAAAEARAEELNQQLVTALAAASTAEAAGERAEQLARAREQQADQAVAAQRGAERRAEAAERAAERAETRGEAAERHVSDARAETAAVREHAERTGHELAAVRALLDELRRRTAADEDHPAAEPPSENAGAAPATPIRARSRRTRPPDTTPSGQPRPGRAWTDIPETRVGRYTVRAGSPVRVEGLRGVHRILRIEQHTEDGRVNVEVGQPGGRPTRTFPADSIRYVRPGSKAAQTGPPDANPGG